MGSARLNVQMKDFGWAFGLGTQAGSATVPMEAAKLHAEKGFSQRPSGPY
jgi:hypothetical protein